MRFTTLTPPKALLVREGLKTNTYADIMASFDEMFVATGAFELPAGSFTAQVLSYLGGSNSESFARAYMETASTFLASLENHQGPIQSKAS